MPTNIHNPACAHRHMGPWAVKPDWFSQMVELFRADRLPLRAGWGDEDAPQIPPYTVEGGVAIVPIVGQMIKGDSKYGGANSVAIRKAIRDANNDSTVKRGVLRIDSPGGTVAGTPELAAEIVAARRVKPWDAYIEDLGASAAIWAASQAESVSMNAAGEAGSIGVFAVVEDTSGRAERLGIKVHVISTGEFKGAFVDGAPIKEGQLAYLREQVEQVNEMFLASVAAGRGMELDAVRAIADGRTFIGQKAVDVGIVDRIESFEEFLGREQAAADKGRPTATARRRMGI